MNTPGISHWTPQALREAAGAGSETECGVCHALRRPGWEALPSTFDEASLAPVGTLRQADADGDAPEPTLDEFHPARTNYWSADAPIAADYHPYNRCDVWACKSCARVFLRYTEYGGYYIEQRIRAVDPALVVDAA